MATAEAAGYMIGQDPVYTDDQITRYATEDPTIFVEFFAPPQVNPGDPDPDFQRYLDLYDELRGRLLEQGLQGYIPEVVDSDADDNWVAFGVPEGLYTLTEVAKSFPAGFDGRDWAWMLSRVLMVLDVGNRRPKLDERNFLVHPKGHGVVLLGWQPIEDPTVYPLEELRILMEKYLATGKDADQQIKLIGGLDKAFRKNRQGQYAVKIDPDGDLLGYAEAFAEYKAKLVQLYGPPQFRGLEIDPNSVGYLEVESQKVRELFGD